MVFWNTRVSGFIGGSQRRLKSAVNKSTSGIWSPEHGSPLQKGVSGLSGKNWKLIMEFNMVFREAKRSVLPVYEKTNNDANITKWNFEYIREAIELK